MLKKNSTVARVKPFYVACSKNGFRSWTMECDQRQLLAQFRSTSKSGISSGAFLVVLQIAMDIIPPPFKNAFLGLLESESEGDAFFSVCNRAFDLGRKIIH